MGKFPKCKEDNSGGKHSTTGRGLSCSGVCTHKMKKSATTEDVAAETDDRPQFSFILSGDPRHLLHCPFCSLPLQLPIFQCRNWHIACASCYAQMDNKCENCALQTGQIRCLALENLIDSIKIPCPNASYGCTRTIPYAKKLDHQASCHYVPRSCLLFGCEFLGSPHGQINHTDTAHSNCSTRFDFGRSVSVSLGQHQMHLILISTNCEEDNGEHKLFVLNRSAKSCIGSFFNVVCIRSTSNSAAEKSSKCQLLFEEGEESIKLESVVENVHVSKWRAAYGSRPTKRFLVVSEDFIGVSKAINLKVIIWRPQRLVDSVICSKTIWSK